MPAALPVTIKVLGPVFALFVMVTLSVAFDPGLTGFVPVMLTVIPVVPPLAASVTGLFSAPTAATFTA